MSLQVGQAVLANIEVYDPATDTYKHQDVPAIVHGVSDPERTNRIPAARVRLETAIIQREGMDATNFVIIAQSALRPIADKLMVTCIDALNSARAVFKATMDRTPTRSHAMTVAQALCDMLRVMDMPEMADTLASEVTELTSVRPS